MHLSTITEDPHVARRAFLDYRRAVREPLRARATEAERELRQVDRELLRAYRELAKGVTLLRLTETIHAGGFETRPARWGGTVALPRIAVATATARRVWCRGIAGNGDVGFSWARTPYYQELSWSRTNSLVLEGVFGNERRDRQEFEATVPTVPPQFRPERGLAGYHVLFEAAWEERPQPADPALIKHIGGDLWAVLATWDLSPLEAAVLGQR